MFLRAGAISLALMLASRLLGLVRESAQAAAFGATGTADAMVLMLSLPDWITTVVAGGAMAYVMLPAWSAQEAAGVSALQRRLAGRLLALGIALGLLLAVLRSPLADLLAGGLVGELKPLARAALLWSAAAMPLALLAALGVTRLQHERDFVGMYGANLVINMVVITALLTLAAQESHSAGRDVAWLGAALLVAMVCRLLWLRWRQTPYRPAVAAVAAGAPVTLPGLPVWFWAALAAGLPLTLPFAARSIASGAGEGALAVFNYAWKLVELPLMLAIQLVASLAFPAIARAFAPKAEGHAEEGARAVRSAFGLAWVLACAATAALLWAAPAIALLLFGWGRMEPQALDQVAAWGRAGAWGLLPQALIAVALTVLAARRRMRSVVAAYAAALLLLLAFGAQGTADGARLMWLMNGLLSLVAVVALWRLGPQRWHWLPWPTVGVSSLLLALAAGGRAWLALEGAVAQLVAGGLAAGAILAATLVLRPELRQALRR